MTARLMFRQVDVFSAEPFRGNPLAVVHEADGLDATTMQAVARWTNLSETTFLIAPTDPRADYRVRIFTPGGELPFAGHPTLGSAHAWLEAGGRPKAERVIQECAIGLVALRRDGARLAFAAPALKRTGAVDEATLEQIASSLRIGRADIINHQWVDNGPGWVAVMLRSRDAVLALEPDFASMKALKLGVIGPIQPSAPASTSDTSGAQFEVRAFVPGLGVPEDPVTGSLNAGIAQWLIGAGLAPSTYIASQGTAMNRAGRVHVLAEDGEVWIGGDSVTRIEGMLRL